MRALHLTSLNWLLLILLLTYQAKAVAIEPFVQTSLSSANNSFSDVPSQTPTDPRQVTYTYYSTHPAIHYLPRSDCVFWLLGIWCTERDYAWNRFNYSIDSSSLLKRSVAEVSNEHSDESGNEPREVRFELPPGESQ